MTGFRSLSEFYAETNPHERTLIIESIRAYHEERQGSMRGGGGGSSTPPGL